MVKLQLSRSKLALLLLLIATSLSINLFAQQDTKVRFSAELYPADARAGESAQIRIKATVPEGWHLYSAKQAEGPQPTSIKLTENKILSSEGDLIEPEAERKLDPNFNVEVGQFAGEVVFAIPVRIQPDAKGEAKVTLEARYQICNERLCMPPETVQVPLSFTPEAGEPRPDRMTVLAEVPEQPGLIRTDPKETPSAGGSDQPTDAFAAQVDQARQSGLPTFLWLSFTAGLIALLTPCVFPMIPVTVSYFSKRSGEETKTNFSGAIAYCLGIMGTFTALGLLVTVLFGASGIQKLAANPVVNIALAVLFVVLAANLFGLFEIVIPSGMVNRASSKSRQGGLLGPILMGLTFSLTTFTCTVPFVGTILVAAAQGDILYPLLGMLAFSSAFAIPFFLLALFPQWLAKMPKSGSWLSTVKVYMGFLELAAALKFISNADLTLQLGWLTKEAFIAIWSIIATLAGLYLIGWIVLGHEHGKGKIGWARRIVGIATLAAGGYLVAALQGAPLGEMSAFLPPDPYPGRQAKGGSITWIHDYQEGLAKAKAEGKPLFVNFTGVT